MPPKKKTRFEGTNGGDNYPWKVLKSYLVCYGPGYHSTFYINAANQKDLTEDGVLLMIGKHGADKRPAEAEGGGVVVARARERGLKRRPM